MYKYAYYLKCIDLTIKYNVASLDSGVIFVSFFFSITLLKCLKLLKNNDDFHTYVLFVLSRKYGCERISRSYAHCITCVYLYVRVYCVLCNRISHEYSEQHCCTQVKDKSISEMKNRCIVYLQVYLRIKKKKNSRNLYRKNILNKF